MRHNAAPAQDGRWHGRDEVQGAAISGRHLKCNTHLVAPPTGAPVPVGQAFLRNKGETLTVQVLFEGKPLPGAKVWQDIVTAPDAPPLVADAEGRVTLPVRNQGLNVVEADQQSPPGTGDWSHSRPFPLNVLIAHFSLPDAARYFNGFRASKISLDFFTWVGS